MDESLAAAIREYWIEQARNARSAGDAVGAAIAERFVREFGDVLTRLRAKRRKDAATSTLQPSSEAAL